MPSYPFLSPSTRYYKKKIYVHIMKKTRKTVRWTDQITKDLRSCHVSANDTSNRAKWRLWTRKADPHHKMGIIMLRREMEVYKYVIVK